MGDAQTHIARDQRRDERTAEMAVRIVAYLENPTDETREAAVEAAARTDEIGRGYLTSATSFSGSIDTILANLESGDEREWDNLLRAAPHMEMDLLIRDPVKLCAEPVNLMQRAIEMKTKYRQPLSAAGG